MTTTLYKHTNIYNTYTYEFAYTCGIVCAYDWFRASTVQFIEALKFHRSGKFWGGDFGRTLELLDP